jgi:Co/Zn/Cd efflux system component
VPRGPSRALLRSANLFNSLGLIIISGMLLWQAVERFYNPVPAAGVVPVIVGLAVAAANYGVYGVARLLREPSQNNAAIRLAYIHNLGDVWVSLAPVAAGLLLLATGRSVFDPLIGGVVALWIMIGTVREVLGSKDELIWPERLVCCHTEHDASAPPVT